MKKNLTKILLSNGVFHELLSQVQVPQKKKPKTKDVCCVVGVYDNFVAWASILYKNLFVFHKMKISVRLAMFYYF